MSRSVPSTTPTAARLSARSLAWSVGERFVLLDLEMDLAAGELLLLSGENGAGKTTLIDLLVGHRRPTRGRVCIDGVSLDDVDRGWLAGRIGVVGHRPGLYLELDALDNLRLFAGLVGRPLHADAAAALLDRVGLARRDQRRRVREYSRGMVQRTAIARLMAVGADIWLLDEPATGLDRDGRALLVELVLAWRDAGAAVLVISHDDTWSPHANRHLHLRGGRLKSPPPVAALAGLTPVAAGRPTP